ncbi:ADP ribosyltransferase [uncultured Caudovirales phage]|uniref:ADP ribosyltransferase n=1 Tax=uncultured Caudovirales phage TaxID=2100421 RepID=A0A6J7X7N3_9CAUD|nr:ADP ribosyltransferase [uncultured Caudovirales phage]CAB4210523.1 ADP ribosyltransferase [uncultured Caudovirales phage]CAB5227129.1 ADP ribosyltransferase [uncultured Caudovirales phage]
MRNTSRFFEPMLVERVFEARTAGKGGQFKKGGGRVEAGAEAQHTQKEVKNLIASNAAHLQSEGELDVRQSVSTYTGMGYRGINVYLRGKNSDGSKPLPPSSKTWGAADGMDTAFEKHGVVLEKEAVLYRGMHAKAISKFEEEGSTVRDKGFVSASASLRMADHFSSGGLPILRMHVPAGTRVLAGSTSEQELILPRGGHMRVGKTRAMYAHPDGSVKAEPPTYSGSARVEFRTVLIKDVYYTAPKSVSKLPPTTGDMYEGEQYHAFRPMETRAVLSAGFLDRITWGEFDVEVVKPGEKQPASESTRFNPFIPLERRMSGLGGQFAKGGGRVPGRANTETGRALEAALAETGPLLQRHAELLAILDSPAFYSSRTSDYQRHVVTQEWQTVAPAGNAAKKKVFEAAAAHAESLQQHQPAIDPHAEKWAGVNIEHRVIVSHPDLPAGSMDSEALAYVVKPDKWMKARDRYVVADTPTVAMNAALRGEQPITSGIKQRISEANYLTKGVTTSDGVVNRTMALTPEHAASITPGDTWESAGFQSVQTGSMSSYDRVHDNPGTVNVSMNIRVPAGTHASDVGVGELILRPGKMTIVSSEFKQGVQDVVAEWNP